MDEMQQPMHRRIRSKWASLPRWFRKFLMAWACVLLSLMLWGYATYILRGQWTPEHLGEWFRLGLTGGM